MTAASLTLAGMLWGYRDLRGTTLTPVWWWAFASLATLVGAEAWIATGQVAEVYHPPLRFAVACLTLCPGIALLGAKRPQDRGWGFIVVSLWAILILPAVELMVLRPGQTLELRDARQWFLVILIALGPLNTMATRMAPAGLLLAIGQGLLFTRQLPGWQIDAAWAAPPVTLFLFAVVAWWCSWQIRLQRHSSGWNAVWRDFRDLFGTLWALRVAQRINAVAEVQRWNVRLGWNGFRPIEDPEARPPTEAELKQAFTNLLRRFVSDAWVVARIDSSVADPGAQD